jgi:hypothetical protein
VCWALNEYQNINPEFWKRMVSENPEATWLIIEGSQKGTDKIFNIFQKFEINENNNINIVKEKKGIQEDMFLGKLDAPCSSDRELIRNNSEKKLFDIYYERFASPRRLIAVSRLKLDKE